MPSEPLVVEEVGSLEELREDWSRLSDLEGDVFKTWEWARAWQEAFGSANRLLLTFSRPGQRPVGIARLSLHRRGPLRFLRFEGTAAADQVGPVCAPSDRPAVAEALRRAVSSLGRPGVLLAQGLMREQGWGPLLGAVTLSSRPSPVLEFGELDWPGWLATRSSNFRHQIQRRERKLVRELGLSYHCVASPDELAETFQQFAAFHDSRWQGESDFLSSGGAVLHLAFARLALQRGWLRLWVANLEGRPAAYLLAYRYLDDYWGFQSARDPHWSETGVGMVLTTHTMRSAVEEGAARYRFLSGRHDYKLRLTNSDAGHETVLVTSPRLAQLAEIGLTRARRLPPPVRARLRAALGR